MSYFKKNYKVITAALLVAICSIQCVYENIAIIAQANEEEVAARTHAVVSSVTGEGSVDAPESAEEGTSVEFTATAADGSELSSVEVYESVGGDFAVLPVDGGSGSYSFTMPTNDAYIVVEFVGVPVEEEVISEATDADPTEEAEVVEEAIVSETEEEISETTVAEETDVAETTTVDETVAEESETSETLSSETTAEPTKAETEVEEASETAVVDESVVIEEASDLDEFIEVATELSSSNRVIVDTEKDISENVENVEGVAYDDTYILSFDDKASLNDAIEVFDDDKNISYSIDGQMTINGLISDTETRALSDNAKYKVAIIDTGSNNANEVVSVIGDDGSDSNGHGTEMSNLVLSYADGNAYILSIKAIGDNGKGSVVDVYNAVQYAIDADVDYILMSISMYNSGNYEAFVELVKTAVDNGITVVASAGNNNKGASKYIPAGIDGVTTIGALNEDLTKLPISNYGDAVNAYVVANSTSEAAAIYLGNVIGGTVDDVAYDKYVTEEEATESTATPTATPTPAEDDAFSDFVIPTEEPEGYKVDLEDGGYAICTKEGWYYFYNKNSQLEFVSYNGYGIEIASFETTSSDEPLGELNLGEIDSPKLEAGLSGTDTGTASFSASSRSGYGTVSNISSDGTSTYKLSDFTNGFGADCKAHYGSDDDTNSDWANSLPSLSEVRYQANWSTYEEDGVVKIDWKVNISENRNFAARDWQRYPIKVYWNIVATYIYGEDAYTIFATVQETSELHPGSKVIVRSGSDGLVSSSEFDSVLAQVISKIRSYSNGLFVSYSGNKHPLSADDDKWSGFPDGDLMGFVGSGRSGTAERGLYTLNYPDTKGRYQIFYRPLTAWQKPTVDLSIKKTGTNSALISGNNCYSLAGTDYKLYTSLASAQANLNNSTDQTHDQLIGWALGEDGTPTNTAVYEWDYRTLGKTLYLVETRVGEGLIFDDSVYRLTYDEDADTVSIDRVSGSATFKPEATLDGDTWVLNMQDDPVIDDFTLTLYKKAANELIDGRDTDLSGATFTVTYYDGIYKTETVLKSATSSVTNNVATLVSDANGEVLISFDTLISGGATYFSNVGAKQLLLGTYVVRETKAPAGYDLSGYYFILTIEQASSGSSGTSRNYIRISASGKVDNVNQVWYRRSEGVYDVYDPQKVTYISTKKETPSGDLFDPTAVTYELWMDESGNGVKTDSDDTLLATATVDKNGYLTWTLASAATAFNESIQPGTYVNADGDVVLPYGVENNGTASAVVRVPVTIDDEKYVIVEKYSETDVKNSFYTGLMGSEKIYYTTTNTASGWTKGTSTSDYKAYKSGERVYYASIATPDNREASNPYKLSENALNHIEWASFDIEKVVPESDTFFKYLKTKVTVNLYWDKNGNGKFDKGTDVLVNQGILTDEGVVSWNYKDNNGFTTERLPLNKYIVEETWTKTYIDSQDNKAKADLFEQLNDSGWVVNSDDTNYSFYKAFTLDTDGMHLETTVKNDDNAQWFGLQKAVTRAGDASEIEFRLYNSAGVWIATGTADTTYQEKVTEDGKTYVYNVTWDYDGVSDLAGNSPIKSSKIDSQKNDLQLLCLTADTYYVREYYPETYYQNGKDNVPYTYVTPKNWTAKDANGNAVADGDDTTVAYFEKSFTLSNKEKVLVSDVITNVRQEGELTIKKLVQLAEEEQTFTFSIYYRGNKAEAENIGAKDEKGNLDQQYLVDKLQVTVGQDTDTTGENAPLGTATITDLPYGWYEIVEDEYEGYQCFWYKTATNTAEGKLVHISDCSDHETSEFLWSVTAYNITSVDIAVVKHDGWTSDIVCNPDRHGELVYDEYGMVSFKSGMNTYLTFYLFEDVDEDGIISAADYSKGWKTLTDLNEDGIATFPELDAGKYIVREITTIDGYYYGSYSDGVISVKDYPVEIIENKDQTVYIDNEPYSEPITVTKYDNEDNSVLLSGATFQVYVDANDNGVWDSEDFVPTTRVGDEIVEFKFIDNGDGTYVGNGKLHFNDGSEYYGNQYILVEVEAPDQYFFVDPETGVPTDKNTEIVFTVESKDTTALDFEVGSVERSVANQTGTVFLYKVDEDGNFLTGATFEVYKDAGCTQKFATLIQDTEAKEYRYKGLGLGVWYLKETESPDGYEIDPEVYAFEIKTSEPHQIVTNSFAEELEMDGKFVDLDGKTTALDPVIDKTDYQALASMGETQTIVDRVTYQNLIVDREYKVTGHLVYAEAFTDADGNKHEAGEVACDPEGNAYEKEVTFTAGVDGVYTIRDNGLSCYGYIDVVFENVNISYLSGYTTKLVTFEEMERTSDGKVVFRHQDLEDELQTKYIPSIGTTLVDKDTQAHIVIYDKEAVLTDTISYERLSLGTTYTVSGILMDKATGEPYLNEDGETVVATGTFTPTEDNSEVETVITAIALDGTEYTETLCSGTTSIDFKLDTTNITKKTVLVAFETVTAGSKNEPSEDEEGTTTTTTYTVAEHKDINDVAQTVTIPSMGTQLTDKQTGTHIVSYGESVTITDYVYYEGLDTTKEYTIVGKLMNVGTGEFLATSEPVKFTPESADGYVVVDFVVDTREWKGKTVAYEYLYIGDKLVGTHTKRDDPWQTIYSPEVGTTLMSDVTETQVAPRVGTTKLTDTISYENLVLGQTYTFKGQLVDKSNDKVVAEGSVKYTVTEDNSTEIETVEINSDHDTITLCSGTVEMTFDLDTSKVEGDAVVAYETVYVGDTDIVVGEHKDKDDEGQTVTFPDAKTTALDVETNSAVVTYSKQVTVLDYVHYTNLIPNKSYTVTGTLIDKATGKPYVDADGNIVTNTFPFIASYPNGIVVVPFYFDATYAAGKKLVAFETIKYEGDIDFVMHADINDVPQTVNVPKIGTTLVDGQTKEHTAALGEDITLVDTIAYEKLVVGQTYVVEGTLVNKATGAPMTRADGSEITASEEFVAETEDGTVDVAFKHIDTTQLGGVAMVAFEELYFLDKEEPYTPDKPNKVEVTEHKNLTDEGQTVYVPEIETTLIDRQTETHTASYGKSVTLTDHVDYKNLIVGKTYTIKGQLMNKDTGDVIATAEKTFEATATEGTELIEFVVDTTALQGATTVAFEDLYHNGVKVATHADLEDENQTVYVPSARTYAETTGGKKSVEVGEKITIVDTVKYTGLTVGTLYRTEATLYLSNGTKVSEPVKVEFTPTTADGEVKVEIPFDTSSFKGGDVIVVFEKVYDVATPEEKESGKQTEDVLITTHEDLTDKDQSITLTSKPYVPPTGYIAPAFKIGGIVLAIVALLGVFIVAKKNRKSNVAPESATTVEASSDEADQE